MQCAAASPRSDLHQAITGTAQIAGKLELRDDRPQRLNRVLKNSGSYQGIALAMP